MPDAFGALAKADGIELQARVWPDIPRDREYFRHGGILLYALRKLAP